MKIEIPDLAPMLCSVIAYVKKYQGEKGFILTDRDDKDAIFDIEYSSEENSAIENQIKAVRVQDGFLEILADAYDIRYDEQTVNSANENDWEPVEDSDTIYFKPTLFNIAENIRDYVDELAEFTFVDLGLPSGKLWATENVKDEDGNESYFTFNEADKTFGKNLPSKEDWNELVYNSTLSWNKERKGYDVVGPNGHSIFLPATGFRDGVGVGNIGNNGYYWSSSVGNENVAYYLIFDGDHLCSEFSSHRRCYGFSVRLCK